ncbi:MULTISPECIES: helix-turn-helix transcriptional regulator [unclassified Crossiella]|uniref:helix-turn-helix transcriptional regulator n=1 Tax=unclassified Crossiella TaxID=2620835 RepID=UPI001FFEAD90|nr:MULTISPECIES: helix-turn-helix transcriptional regulator [unclassified Crossiella]MCK2243459.1 helix-turn-helix transcriptional regulator [Crossiella sp. S99.2]MCK2257317.1 helix-turn-helix transcriptional regulator [Crossiella sp. S99.1]
MTSLSGQRRRELGELLRRARGRIQPPIADRPGGRRRRTPGLRREEVARAAGVSTTWYTWLEQGRSITASARVLDAIATVLALSDLERAYLFRLGRGEEAPLSAGRDLASPGTLAFLDALAIPAYLVDDVWVLQAYNRPAATLFGFGELPGDSTNLLELMLTRPAARSYVADWPEVSRAMVWRLRLASSLRAEEPAVRDLVARLRAVSPEVNGWWENEELPQAREDAVRVLNTWAGAIAFRTVVLRGFDSPQLMLHLFAPVPDGVSGPRLERALSGKPAVDVDRTG